MNYGFWRGCSSRYCSCEGHSVSVKKKQYTLVSESVISCIYVCVVKVVRISIDPDVFYHLKDNLANKEN